jgi:beta-lactam-binding protein with PASTA domain/tRNA A-37 threonylcarbamoyl transferase component Bud32
VSVNSTDPLIGRLIDGRYQVRSRIARGGMATVYLATDLRLERRVAIKVMHGHLADDSQYKARFIQEARSAARLAHPNVVNVYDQGQDGETAYLVMEYLPGITLRDLLQEHKVLTTVQATDIMEAILSGLSAAHKNGIVHRDLKPENVLLADDGRIKIGDFGLARAASANTATGNALLGTIAYLSPELVTRGVADTRSDIYAVGIMLYEMLAGEQPFRGEQAFQIAHQHANDTVPMPSLKNPRVPVELDELVLWATARDPDQRPRDARAMLDQLHEAESLLRGDDAGANTRAQRTVVMPTGFGAGGFGAGGIGAGGADAGTGETARLGSTTRYAGTAETQAFSLKGRHRTGPVLLSGAVDSLSTKTMGRRRKGWWMFALVIVLAGAFAGTGWYFGPGPGGHITVPVVSGQTPAAATSTLLKLGLTVNKTPGQASSPTVPVGQVVGTTPRNGTSVVRDSTITILVSQGPKLLPYTSLAGKTEAEARTSIADMHFTYDAKNSSVQFDDKIAQGVVISALGADKADLASATSYGDQQSISLVISAGKIPNVVGKTLADATTILKAKNLNAVQGQDAYSDTIASGLVISAVPQGSSGGTSGTPVVLHPGGSVQLILSKGPEQVQVPAIEGMGWSDAKAALTAAGFTVTFKDGVSTFLSALGNAAVVKSASPGGGSTADKGSAIVIALKTN